MPVLPDHRTGWTCKHSHLNRLCPKIGPITGSDLTGRHQLGWAALRMMRRRILRKCSFLKSPPSLHVTGWSFWLLFNVTDNIKNYLSHDRLTKSKIQAQMWGSNHIFSRINVEDFEILVMFNQNYEPYDFLMLRHNSNVVFQSLFSNSILHNDTCIKASKVSIFYFLFFI